VRVIGGKVRRSMSENINENGYTDEPLGDIQIIEDFLPKPEDLVFKEDNVKITLGLSRRSVEFFKREAKKYHTQYQKMIRRLLDLYAARHQ
jgi:predicted DNA binding CopG/RHH family protein